MRCNGSQNKKTKRDNMHNKIWTIVSVATGLLFWGVALSETLESGSSAEMTPRHTAAASDITRNLSTLDAATLQPDQGGNHIAPGTSHVPYLTRPATSGPHWSTKPTSGAPDGAPVRWGVYDQPLPDEALVHNLEHGGIGLHYKCPEVCPDLVKQLRESIPKDFTQFVLSPYPSMDHRIALTAWRHLLYLDSFDGPMIQEFIRAFKNRAPEDIPENMF